MSASCSFSKIVINKYHNPFEKSNSIGNDISLNLIETNIDFNKDGYYRYDYSENKQLKDYEYIEIEDQNPIDQKFLVKQALRYNDQDTVLQNYYCKSIGLNTELLSNELFLRDVKEVCSYSSLKYMILSSSDDLKISVKNIWITDYHTREQQNYDCSLMNHSRDQNSPFKNSMQLKILGLQTDLETSFPLLLKLRSQYNSPNIFIKSFNFESYKLLPFIFGFKKGDLKSLCDYYKVDVVYPSLLCNIDTFVSKDDRVTKLYILSQNSETDVMLVRDILQQSLNTLKDKNNKLIIKNLNNLNNDYINFEQKLKFFHSDMNFLIMLNRLMFEYSCFIELNLGLKQIVIFGENEIFILDLLKVLHLKLYNKVYEFKISFKNENNYEAFKDMILCKEPSLTAVCEPQHDDINASIQLIGDQWESFFLLYINLNQENLSYAFYIELSNEFKEFIIGKKFGKINKIEKQCNMKCKISILINNEKNKSNKEFITLELKSDSFIEVINCLKLIQLELPYEKKLYIPEAFHKFIIGMNGENIQSIMRRYNCFIQFLNTFDITQNNYSFIRHCNVIIRCPIKNYDNVAKVVKELHSLSMEIFNLNKIQENDEKEADSDLTGLKLLKLNRKELDLMVFNNSNKKLHKNIGALEMKYNLFIRFPEFDEQNSHEEELFIILKSCKHNTVLKLQEGEDEMRVLKMKGSTDRGNGTVEEEDENLKLCFEELLDKYIPKKDKSFDTKRNAAMKINIESITEDLRKMVLWKYNILLDKDSKDSKKVVVYSL